MTYTPHGRHLIAGAWMASPETFASEPAHGVAHAFSVGTVDLIDRACHAAAAAFPAYAATPRAARAAFLDRIADECWPNVRVSDSPPNHRNHDRSH